MDETLKNSCNSGNPLLDTSTAPFGAPMFDKIAIEHYIPAFEVAIEDTRVGIDQIVNCEQAPTFENTIEALEYNGRLLGKVSGVFYALLSAHTNDEMERIAEEISPKLTALSNDISLNETLFDRVRVVFDQRESLGLENDQLRLLNDTYKSFRRSGAGLSAEDKVVYREVTTELSKLSLKFSQNVLNATNAFTLNITPDESAKVEELPEFVKEAMAEEAKSRGQEGWSVTLQIPSYLPFLIYSTQRDLKEKLWRAYGSKGFTEGDNDNREIIKRLAELKLKVANLLGYATYADYALENRMAHDTKTVNTFLEELLSATKSYAQADVEVLKSCALESGVEEFMPWDLAYFEERYKSEHYDLNQEEIKQYLELSSVKNGVFGLATKLYGLKFVENKEIPVFHKDVEAYEVYDDSGRFMSLLYMDYFPRESKRGGAWMTTFREMSTDQNGEEIRPFVTLTCNFTKPTAETPSLLTFDELTTLLHEFGHGLHGIFAEGRYESQTGTNVARDFVELPSQIMENWAFEKEFLDMFAVHYKTGERMPQELIENIINAKNYMAAYQNVRQLSFGILDMAWHTITESVEVSVSEFEQRALESTRLMPRVEGVSTSTAFSHIFAGGYAAGYYSYKWAEVLEADAFMLFRQKGIFDHEVARSFRDNVLSKGDTMDAMDLYVNFRGHKPDVSALIDKMALK